MASNDRRRQRREERRQRRAAGDQTAAERARERITARENGDGPEEASVSPLSIPATAGSAERGGLLGRLRAIAGGGDGRDRTKPKLKKLRAALVIMGLGVLALVSWVFGIMMAVAQDLPRLENRVQFENAENSVILDRNGTRLATLTNNEGRILVTSDEIAPVMKEAVVAIEDRRFYEHRGVDFQGIARALYQDVLAGSAEQGASTITQQFVKNALEAQDSRTIFQKFREAALAYQLERNWSKDKIITEYLNSIYFGEGAYGIEAAARTFFGSAHAECGEAGKPTCASQLLPYEAALLAGIIASPAAYSPRANPQDSESRRNLVLQSMAEEGFITTEELTDYSGRPMPVDSLVDPPSDDSIAPYFTSWLRQQLVDRYGAGQAFGGGLKVTSTLDLELQQQAEAIAEGTVGHLGLDSSVVVLDNETAGVLAMVGGFDYEKAPFNLATNGLRQPGSSFKPFTLVTALEQGHTTGEVFSSQPIDLPFEVRLPRKSGDGTKVVPDLFNVNNYDDNYLGSVSLATATTYSDNSVFAQLGTAVGPENVAKTAADLGIKTDLSADYEYSIDGRPFAPYNPAMILGGLTSGVNTLEMAHAYNSIEEDGNQITGTMASSKEGPVGIVKVEAGDEGEEEPVKDKTGASGVNESIREQVISPETADTAAATLATVVTSGTGKRAQTSEPTWGKTGTTDDNGDAWFCGATPDITACVWVGHADTVKPMLTEYAGGPVDGGTFPAEIFADVVNAYLSVEAGREVTGGDTTDTTDTTEIAPPVETVAPAPVIEEAPVEEAPIEPEAPVEQPPDGGGAVVPERRK